MATEDNTDDRQEEVLRAKAAWAGGPVSTMDTRAESIAVDVPDDRKEAIMRAKKWSKPISKIVKKVIPKKKK